MAKPEVRVHKRLLFTKDILKSIVIDRDRKKIGRVYDVSISKISDSKISGILIGPLREISTHEIISNMKSFRRGKRQMFIPWDYVYGIRGNKFLLRKSIDDIPEFEPINQILLTRKILDEQLDLEGRYCGRVDEIELIYDMESRKLLLSGFYSGIAALFLRLSKRMKFISKKLIPWIAVKEIARDPYRIVLKNK